MVGVVVVGVLVVGALALMGAVELGAPETPSTCQMPPKPLKFWPLTSPLEWSSAKRYSGSPFSVTCSMPFVRFRIASLPCTPAPRTSFVAREGTVNGGQNLRHSLLVQSRCLEVSGVRTYSVLPLALTSTLWPSVVLEAEPTVAGLDASAIAANAAPSASATVVSPISNIVLRRRGRRGAICCCP